MALFKEPEAGRDTQPDLSECKSVRSASTGQGMHLSGRLGKNKQNPTLTWPLLILKCVQCTHSYKLVILV